MKQHYGATGRSDSNMTLAVKLRRANGAVLGQDRSRAYGVRVVKAKAAIRRLVDPRAEISNLMRDHGLTEGKVRTLIAVVAREKN